MSTTFLSFLNLLAFYKKPSTHWPFLSIPIFFLSLSALFPLTHSPLYFSYSALLFARCPCLPSPRPALPPTRLLIHPLGEQYRGELTTVITIAISCGWGKKVCTQQEIHVGAGGKACLIHVWIPLYMHRPCYKLGHQLIIVCVVVWVSSAQCPMLITAMPLHAYTYPQYRINAAGPSMYT